MKTSFTNDQFFSDPVMLDDDIKKDVFAPLASAFSVPLQTYLIPFEAHIAAVKSAAANHPDVQDLRVSWNPATQHITMHGSKPWTAEKIAEFEAAAKNEKSDIDAMRALIKKYPGKAAEALGYLLEAQKHAEGNQ